MLKVRNLTVQYGDKKPVVKNFNLSVKKVKL